EVNCRALSGPSAIIARMRWIGISGSWGASSSELVNDVQLSVRNVMEAGNGIVTGGALGVDQLATTEALRHDPEAKRIKIIIPSSLEIYAAHYRNRASEDVITIEQAEALIGLLTIIQNKQSLTEMTYTSLNEKSYYARNTEVLNQSDELLVFQVNGSAGTQDAIDKARELGMPVQVRQYEIR
ncbi:MAG TPA: hypothetical protein VFH39_00980, partial [Candidatus Saccharimonadales bacterium]|nr:hypothetical protein [Candidatus Saccharimonadales bacterium]